MNRTIYSIIYLLRILEKNERDKQEMSINIALVVSLIRKLRGKILDIVANEREREGETGGLEQNLDWAGFVQIKQTIRL